MIYTTSAAQIFSEVPWEKLGVKVLKKIVQSMVFNILACPSFCCLAFDNLHEELTALLYFADVTDVYL